MPDSLFPDDWENTLFPSDAPEDIPEEETPTPDLTSTPWYTDTLPPEEPYVPTGTVYPSSRDAAAALASDPRLGTLLNHLNEAQYDAVQHLTGPLLIVAGPGSGKTRVLTHRVASLVTLGVPAWQIMAVTFTNKAAGEMRERIATMVGDDAARAMWVSTFHSACARIIRQYHTVVGLPAAFSILDAADARKVVKTIMQEQGGSVEDGAVKDIMAVISRAKNNGVTPDSLGVSPHPHDRAVAPFYALYQRRLSNLGSVDFDDLLTLAVTILTTHAPALQWIRRRARYLLVDEVQDTNAVQVALLRLICPPTSTTRPDGPVTVTELLRKAEGNICMVGDTDQAIYSWRAANPAGLLTFWDEFSEQKVIMLEQNYRSTQVILDVVRALIAPNPALHRPRLFTTNPVGDPVVLYVAEDDRDEADWVIRRITGHGGSLSDHAVLFRTNAQTRVFEETLTRSGTPYQVLGALRFYDRAEIKDALSYLRVAINPADALNLARCINTPKRGIGDTTVTKLVTAARDAGHDPITHLRAVVAAGSLPRRSSHAIAAFLAIYDAVVAACHHGPAEALRVVADVAGLRAELKKDTTSGIDRLENLNELIQSAESFIHGTSPTSSYGGTLSALPGIDQTLAYLENVALVSSADSDDAEDVPRLSLLTAHASKGKEFPHVYVVGVEDNLYPHERSQEDDDAIAEERRLLFVACSRAEKTLALSRCQSRFVFNRSQSNPPSPFLNDLPDAVTVITSPRSTLRPRYPAPSPHRQQNTYRPAAAPSRTFGGKPSAPTAKPTTKPTPAKTTGPRVTPSQLSPGCVVKHTVFGQGTVVTVDGSKAAICFGGVTKTLDLTMAPLTLA